MSREIDTRIRAANGEYTEVSFDGNILFSRILKAIAFIDPDDPQSIANPVFGWPEMDSRFRGNDNVGSGNDIIWSKGEPEGRFVVHEHKVYSLETKKEVDTSLEDSFYKPERIVSLGKGYYLLWTKYNVGDRKFAFLYHWDGTKFTDISGFMRDYKDAADSRSVYIDGNNTAWLFDPNDEGKPIELEKNVKRMALSADGKLVLLELFDGGIMPYDLKRPDKLPAGERKGFGLIVGLDLSDEHLVLPHSSAPVSVVLRSSGPTVYDVRHNQYLNGYVTTDPTGRISVMVNQEGTLKLFDHQTGEWVHKVATGQGGQTIKKFWFGRKNWHDPTYRYFIQTLEDGRYYELELGAAKPLDGKPILDVKPEDLAWRAEVSSKEDSWCELRVDLKRVGFQEHSFLSGVEGLLQYMKPDYDGVIKETIPEEKKYLDLRTLKETRFQGEIVRVSTDKVMGLMLETVNNGRAQLWNEDKMIPLIAVDDKIPRRFLIEQLGKYYGLADSNAVPFNLEIEILEYPQVSFDGKYFVFVNPETLDAIWVDPENLKPEKHIKGWPKDSGFRRNDNNGSGNDIMSGGLAVTDTKPDDNLCAGSLCHSA